jgi:hypothetical protein
MQQRNIRIKDISNIQKYFELAHYKLQHLFCWRQRLFDCNKKNTLAYKPHGCCHFVWFIPLYGPPFNFNTQLYENMHIKFGKQAYRKSSRRHDTKLQDMMKGLQFRRIANVLGKRIRSNDDDIVDDDDDEDDVVTHRANTSIYNTPEGVIYEGSHVKSDVQELVLHMDVLVCKVKGTQKLQCLNPNINLDLLWSAIKRCVNVDVQFFCRSFGTRQGKFKISTSKFKLTLQ